MLMTTLSQWFQLNQELLWFTTIAVDLSFAIILFRFFGRQGLYATIVISLLLANLQGPKLTEIFGLQTSMGVILYSSIYDQLFTTYFFNITIPVTNWFYNKIK